MLLPGGTTLNIPRPPVREGVREQGEIVAWWGDVGDAREEVGQVCSDRHQTCTLIEQRLELNNFIVISHRFSRSLVIEIHTYPAPGTTYRRRIL